MASNVQKAGEEADRMIAELNQQRLAAEAAARGESVEEQPAAAEAITQPEAGEAGNQTDVGVKAEVVPVVDNSELSALRKEVEAANQRWKVLQGMIDKKEAEADNMRALLAQLSQRQEAPKNEVQQKLVTEQDEEGFGADWIDLSGRVALKVFNENIARVMDRLARLEQSVDGVSKLTSKTSAEMFDEALTRQVPDWEAVNKDPAFIAWLQEEEGFTGRTKLDLLTDAYTNGELARTVRFFNAFKEVTGRNTAPVAAAPVKDNVTKLIAPGKSKSSTTPQVAQDTSNVWSKADISRLYEDKRNGRITQEEFDKAERDLFKAQNEGRIAA